MKKKRIIVILTFLGIFVLIICASAAGIYLGWKNGVFLPKWITWEDRYIEDQDSKVTVELKNRNVKVYVKDSLIWESPKEVKVQDILFEDIDHDGSKELMLLCWKIGKYGMYRPFWEEKDENDRKWSQHIFIYDYKDENIHQQWLASDIGIQVEHWSFTEEQFLRLEQTNEATSYWAWLSWGLQFVREE